MLSVLGHRISGGVLAPTKGGVVLIVELMGTSGRTTKQKIIVRYTTPASIHSGVGAAGSAAKYEPRRLCL